MAKKRVRVRLVTSHPIGAYGGIQLDEAVVAEVADAVASGSIPMHFQHDISRPVHVSSVIAGTERLEDGYLAAWSEFDVEKEVWEVFQEEMQAAGAPGGMSISMTAPLEGAQLASDSSSVVAADAHHFSDEEILEATARLTAIDPSARGERLYQFSYIPEAKVVFDLLLPFVLAVGPSIAASVIYDAAKSFLGRSRDRVVFNLVFRETRRGTRKLQIHLEASTEEQLRTALEGLPRVLETGAAGTFTSSGGSALQAIESVAEPEADAAGLDDAAVGDPDGGI